MTHRQTVYYDDDTADESTKTLSKKENGKREMRKMRRDIQNKASNLFNRKHIRRVYRINYTESICRIKKNYYQFVLVGGDLDSPLFL